MSPGGKPIGSYLVTGGIVAAVAAGLLLLLSQMFGSKDRQTQARELVARSCAEAPAGSEVCRLAQGAADGIRNDGCAPDIQQRLEASIQAVKQLPMTNLAEGDFGMRIQDTVRELALLRETVCPSGRGP